MRFMVQVENAEKVSRKWIPSNLKGKKLEEQEEGRSKLLACIFLGGCHGSRHEPCHTGTARPRAMVEGMVAERPPGSNDSMGGRAYQPAVDVGQDGCNG